MHWRSARRRGRPSGPSRRLIGPLLYFALGLGAAITAGLSLTVLAQAPSSQRLPGTPVATADAAIQELIQATGGTYAGDCQGTTSPANLGQICSRFVAQRSNLRAYLVGRTFGEFSSWVFVGQLPAGWAPMSVAPVDQSSSSLSIPWPAG